MRPFLPTIIALFIFHSGISQEVPSTFTLEEAVAYALEHNRSSINAERDIEDAQKQKWETIADGLPQISGDISYQNQIKQPISLIPAEFLGGGARDL